MDTLDFKISSFSEPTAEDLAHFDSLSNEQQRALILGELSKTDDGNTQPLTPELSKKLFARGVERASPKNEAN